MSDWTARRFWTDVTVEPAAGGWQVRLDARPVRTPAKSELVLPTERLAHAVAEEWRAQGKTVDPASMPFTRSANAAIDKVAPQRAEVSAMLAGYGATDLLCYRADGPAGLRARQAAAWDPLLDWASDTFGARLVPTTGVMPIQQDSDALRRLARATDALDPWTLTAFHDLVTLSGSLVIGLATLAGVRPAEDLWQASRIDELWQIEQWGEDAEAAEHATLKMRAFLHADRFYRFGPGNGRKQR